MQITKLEEADKSKVRVYIDEEYHFTLYQKDCNLNHLKENETISEALYQDILINTVLRRAKQKALALLKFKDRTEQELIQKLKQSDYPERVIIQAIAYVMSYHYIDDERYARSYIRNNKNLKSKRQIRMELNYKGIKKEDIEEAMQEEYDDEDSAILKAIQKKSKKVSDMDPTEKLKLSASLYRKGFTMDLIKKYVQ